MKKVYWFKKENLGKTVSEICFGDVEKETKSNYYLCDRNMNNHFTIIILKKRAFESKKSCLECYKGVINGLKAKKILLWDM